MQLDTSKFCEFICEPCLEQFNKFIRYRDELIANQTLLSVWFDSPLPPASIWEEEHETLPLDLVLNVEVIVNEDGIEFIKTGEAWNLIPSDIGTSDKPRKPRKKYCDRTVNCRVSKLPKCVAQKSHDQIHPQHGFKACSFADCDKRFRWSHQLLLHLKKVHRMKFDRLETTCLECRIVFNTAEELANHKMSHNCKFACEICWKNFKHSISLRAHLKNHHRSDEIQPFVCGKTDCNARFNRAAQLTKHWISKHREFYECEVCHLSFLDRNNLHAHIQ